MLSNLLKNVPLIICDIETEGNCSNFLLSEIDIFSSGFTRLIINTIRKNKKYTDRILSKSSWYKGLYFV